MDDIASMTDQPNDQPAPDTPRKLNVLVRLAALLLIVASGFLIWWLTREAGVDEAKTLRSQVDALTHEVAQLRNSTQTVRARLDDGEKVDKSMREQLLGLDQRAKLVEDSVASLADKRLSGHDALLLDEAELLLTLGGARYALFHDAAAAKTAYAQADIALSEIEDATFVTVRQSVAAEIAALNAAQTSDGAAATLKLAQLREQALQWPAASSALATPAPAREPESRLARLLGGFVQIHYDDAAQTRATLHAPQLARELFLIDLREAEAAAFARDDARFHAALQSARAEFGAAFAVNAPAVAAAAAELDALNTDALAPPPPALLGTALKELRNLRATHALREGRPGSLRPGGEGK
jgi:uroporphyrin-3 C-methyltransferase